MPLNYEIWFNITLHSLNEYDPLDIMIFLNWKMDICDILRSKDGWRVILFQLKYIRGILGPSPFMY